MIKELLSKLKESVVSILPIIILIIVLNFAAPSFSLDPGYNMNAGPVFTSFMISIVPLILGLALFNMGAEKSMGKIGELVGTSLTKKKSLILLAIIALLLGTLITIAEPDLTVLSLQLMPAGPNWTLILVASLGVGVMLAVAVIRVILQKSIKVWLVIAYALVFALGCMANPEFFPVVFDSGGATTSAVSSPFILSFGIGIAAVRGGKNSEDDSFGYAGICSLGPLISVMIMGIILGNNEASMDGILDKIPGQVEDLLITLNNFNEIGPFYLNNFVSALKDVALSLSPIVVFFFIYNFILKVHAKTIYSILIGIAYTFVGLVIFLMGANAGFIPVAATLGQSFTDLPLALFLLFGFVVGNMIILAEPAVHVLADQVTEVTSGVIRKWQVFLALCLAAGVSVLLNVIRIYFHIPIMMMCATVYIIGFVLCFIVPDLYVAIAFDSTGVATGTLSSCFLLPMFIGYTNSLYISKGYTGEELASYILADGFGIIGMISTTPIIAVELLGLIGVVKSKLTYKKALESIKEVDDSQVIHLPSYQEVNNVH